MPTPPDFSTGAVLTAAQMNQIGLWKIKEVTLASAADSGTAFQSIFSSSFNSYKIVCHTLTAATNGALPRMTFYYGTNTEQTTTYYSAVTNSIFNGTSNLTSVNNGAYIGLGAACDNIGDSGFVIDILGVGSAGKGTVNIQYVDAYNGSFASGGGLVGTSQTYTGVKFFMSVGNIAMTATVYGYRI